jgi:hypothetical protein
MRDRTELAEANRPMTTTRIYNSGAWTVETDGATERGCFDKKELKEIRKAVQSAPWKITSSPIACFAYDPNFTEMYVQGSLRYTERMCSGKQADSESMAAISLVKNDIAAARPAPSPAPPPAPPVVTPPPPPVVQPPIPTPTPMPPPPPPSVTCAAVGTPLFEIRKRSDVAAETSTTTIYNTGAWTFQPIDKDGHAGAFSAGCFTKQTIGSLRQVINESPWTTSFNRIVCRAYSASFTEYYVHGSLEYTARLCGAQRLDEKSLGAIQIVEGQLASVLPKTALEKAAVAKATMQ